MKKALKGVALVLAMGVILISLAGCASNKLVATKATEDEIMGTYKEEVVITFKKDKVTNIEKSMEFDNEETAEGMYVLYDMGMKMSEDDASKGMEVKQDGKKLVITMDATTYAKSKGISDEKMTKDALKASLEEDGYTVK